MGIDSERSGVVHADIEREDSTLLDTPDTALECETERDAAGDMESAAPYPSPGPLTGERENERPLSEADALELTGGKWSWSDPVAGGVDASRAAEGSQTRAGACLAWLGNIRRGHLDLPVTPRSLHTRPVSLLLPLPISIQV